MNILEKASILTACTFTFLFGEWGIGLQCLIIVMILDFVTGLLCAYKNKCLSSKVGFHGLEKKFSILTTLILAVLLDRLLMDTWVFRTLVIYFYIAIEGLSILENTTKLGVPIPTVITDSLIQLKNKGDGSNDELSK